MNKYILTTIIIWLAVIINFTYSQTGVSINTSGNPPDTTSILDISSTTDGILIPRMTEAQRNAILSPAAGLMVYQTDGTLPGFYYNSGTPAVPAWVFATNSTQIQTNALTFATATGSPNAYAVNITPAVTAYTTGMTVNFKANGSNTGACTLSLNGLTAQSIKKNVSADLAADDIKTNQLVTVIYDGTNFQMTSATGNSGGGGGFTTSATFSASTCAGPKLAATWGDFYPSAVAAGYLLENCNARSYYGSDPAGWITLGYSASGCSGGSSPGNFSPTPGSTWTSTIYSSGSNQYWFAVYGRISSIQCFK